MTINNLSSATAPLTEAERVSALVSKISGTPVGAPVNAEEAYIAKAEEVLIPVIEKAKVSASGKKRGRKPKAK